MSKIQDLASLITIRNYIVSARENRNIFRGNTYKLVDSKITEINTYLVDTLLQFDVSSLQKEVVAQTEYVANLIPDVKEALENVVIIPGTDSAVTSSIVISNDGVTINDPTVTITPEPVVSSEPKKDMKKKKVAEVPLVSEEEAAKAAVRAEDEALIAERVAAQKAALKAQLEEKKKIKNAQK